MSQPPQPFSALLFPVSSVGCVWSAPLRRSSFPSPACPALLFFCRFLSSSTLLRLEVHLGELFLPSWGRLAVAFHSLVATPGNAGGRSRGMSPCLPQARRVAKPLLPLSCVSLRIFCPLRRAVEVSAASLRRSCLGKH